MIYLKTVIIVNCLRKNNIYKLTSISLYSNISLFLFQCKDTVFL